MALSEETSAKPETPVADASDGFIVDYGVDKFIVEEELRAEIGDNHKSSTGDTLDIGGVAVLAFILIIVGLMVYKYVTH